MAAYRVNLAALKNNGGSASATVDLGKTRSFLAWGSVTMVDSLSDFDDDNAYAFDIFTIDGVKTPTAVYGGAHWGPLGSGSNVYQGAWVGSGRYINMWLRSIHTADLDTYGVGCVVTLD
jgi:hypothetical protein